MNLYQQIKTDPQYYARSEFHAEMDNKLYALFRFIFHTELKPFKAGSSHYFEYSYNSSSMLRPVYSFLYDGKRCMAAIEVSKFGSLTVIFTFALTGIPHNMMLQANAIKIMVTDDLDFKSASLQKRFNFGWNSNYLSNKGSDVNRTSIFFNKSIDRDFNIQTAIELFVSGRYQNISFTPNNSLYFNDDTSFENAYIRLLEYCEQKPDAFSSVFTDYPTHLDMTTGTPVLNDFLVKFEDDYRNNLPVLKDKLLFLDMQEI